MALGLLPLMSANAYAASPDPAMLYTQFSGGVSTANDGVNQSIHLLATADPTATSVQFSYSTDGGTTWVDIGAPASESNGVYSMEWTPSSADYVNLTGHTTIDIQAQGMAGGAKVGAADSVTVDITGLVTGASVDISNPAGSAVGAYPVPSNTAWSSAPGDTLGVVSGTTSGSAVAVSSRPSGTPSAAVVTGSSPIKDFTGVVDFGASYFPHTGVSVVGANVDSGASDDAEVLSVYQQKIASVTASAVTPNVQAGSTTNIVVTVKDQNGKPVVGAHVTDEGSGEDQYTGSNGQVTFKNWDSTANGGAGAYVGYGAGTYKFYVDTSSSDGYDSGIDFERSVTVTSYTPVATSISTSSDLGNVVDNDESPKINVTVKDQNGNEMSGEGFSYYWSMVDNTGAHPADGSTASGSDGTPLAKDWTGSDAGKYTLHAWIEKDGTPGPTAGDVVAPSRTFTVGESGVVWDKAPLAQVPAGATTALNGTLEIVDGASGSVIDGAPLGKRDVSFGYTAGTGGGANSQVTESSPVKADGNGDLTLHVADPAATPQKAELGAKLDAQLKGDSDQAAPALDVDFLTSLAPKTVTVSSATPLFDAANTPGRPVDMTLTVTNTDGVALTNTQVTISTDHGFFTPYAADANHLTPDPTPSAEGDLYGNWKSLGSSITRTTDSNGQVKVTLGIARDAGFDADGMVTATVTGTAGAASGDHTVDFTTMAAPLNAGGLSVAFSDASQQDSTALPNARVSGQTVCFDVKATDQFGNRVGVPIDSTSADSKAPVTAGGTASNFEGGCGATVDATAATQAGITATWKTPPSDVYTDSDGTKAGFQYDAASHGTASPTPADISAGSPQVNWYDVDLSNSSFTLGHDTSDVVAVGTVVTETLSAMDQFGQPISGVDVQFFRSGPTPQDGSANASDVTNGQGVAIHSFAGTGAGTAHVTATETDGSTVLAKVTDSVTFKEHIKAVLRGRSARHHRDVLRVKTSPDAWGAMVVFKRGHHVIGKAKVNSNGVAKLRVRDHNGRRFSRYHARVRAGALTFPTHTNWIRIR